MFYSKSGCTSYLIFCCFLFWFALVTGQLLDENLLQQSFSRKKAQQKSIFFYKDEKFPLPTAFAEQARQSVNTAGSPADLLAFNGQNFSISYNEIVGILDSYATVYSGFTELSLLSQVTFENRPIIVFKVHTLGRKNQPNRKAVVVNCGTHASEWVSVAACVAIIRELISSTTRKDVSWKQFDWIIIPVLNPDGYEYSLTVDSTWRKNRSVPPNSNINSTFSTVGVDLNRNWPFRWAGAVSAFSFLASDAIKPDQLIGPMVTSLLSQARESSPTYAGDRALSERETQALARHVFLMRHRLHAYITVHGINNARYLMIPYSNVATEKIAEHDRFMEILTDVAGQLRHTFRVKYVTGAAGQILYPVRGSDIDWMYGIAAITNSFAIELKNVMKKKKKPPTFAAEADKDDHVIRTEAEKVAQEAVFGIDRLIKLL